MNKIINMIIRQLTRKLVNKGVNAGINKASSLGRKRQAPQLTDDDGTPVEADAPAPTAEQMRQQKQARKMARQTRQAAKVMRRSMRG
ncbi:hypothetical protein [Sulfitobacter sabulilitoris]|uniref:Uncharacterized protein n=1 Tax=Sulfitobacter sabulilitoris TaxID=2562655 RepID=A0A5S3PQL3_9RHOB|nr:hypothetical protein [Sulfitobacter sabulilitoris]TMM54835.1 hypothetical protein FDT80_04445 [Sulfitobacter sabulilitoris]